MLVDTHPLFDDIGTVRVVSHGMIRGGLSSILSQDSMKY